MKKQIKNHTAVSHGAIRAFRAIACLQLASLLLGQGAFGGSATWSMNPVSSDWNNPENWVPNTVPNGPEDVATFDTSNLTEVSLSAATEVGGITFQPGGSAYTIRTQDFPLTLSGAGIINNSGVTENFTITNDLSFHNSASAGTATEFNANARSTISFYDSSSGGDGAFFLTGSHAFSPSAYFYDNSTAANASFTLTPNIRGTAACYFYGSSSAGNGVLIAGGGKTGACTILFLENSTADHATITAGAGISGGNGGGIFFGDDSDGGSARIILLGHGGITGQSEGNLYTQHNQPGLTIGSLEGNGLVEFEDSLAIKLTVGSNNLSTTFSGLVENFSFTFPPNPLIKFGTGTLTLSGTNYYTGPRITVQEGRLLIDEKFRVGFGKVQVAGGELGGTGTIHGVTTVGKDTGTTSSLAPGIDGIGVCTFRRALTFRSDGIYSCELDSNAATADKIAAQGLTITKGALISLVDLGDTTIPIGTVFIVVDNTDRNAIAGQFNNLADGGTITVGSNTLQANYEGGDGNDLTLTVVP